MSIPNTHRNDLRYDLRLISSLISSSSRVLGLGCGEGELLHSLKTQKDALCTGIELDADLVSKGVAKGLNIVQGDLNEEMEDYGDKTFDYVVLSQTLQQIFDPARVIRSMLRIGHKGIVSFPNFSHFENRCQLFFKGKAPVSSQLPYQWHNTPNIRVITIRDFREYAREVGFAILEEIAINTDNNDKSGRRIRFLSNLRATYGIFLIGEPA